MKVKLDSISLLEKHKEIKINKSKNVKDNSKLPEDIIDISKRTIQATNSKQVQLIYIPYNNEVNAVILSEHEEKIEVKRENMPQELRNIQDVKHFQGFLENAYVKVNVLSNGDYNLYVNHRLLGGSKKYLDKINKVAYHISNITPQGALECLDIDNQKYKEVDDNTLMKVIKLTIQFVLTGLSNNSLNIEVVNKSNFEHAIDTKIFNRQEQLINSKSYDLLFPFKNGLNALKNKIFNKEDPFTVHAVKCFFNSVDQGSQNELWIKEHLKNDRFVCHIYINLIAKFIQAVNTQFINYFNQFQVQAKPIQSEYTQYGIPKAGFCHGSCITIANLNDFSNRNEILNQSVLLQNEYIQIRNPSEENVDDQFIQLITSAISNLESKPPESMIPRLIKTKNSEFLKFLSENEIDIENIYISSRKSVQETALNSASIPLKIFNGAESILDDSPLSLGSFNSILNFLNNKIQSLMQGNSKHMVLITLREKADMSEATKLIKQENFVIPQTHDILLRIDTNNTGNIRRIIFSDLQETGLHIIDAISDAKNIKDANPESIELVKFYVKNSAINMFDEISAKYIAKPVV